MAANVAMVPYGDSNGTIGGVILATASFSEYAEIVRTWESTSRLMLESRCAWPLIQSESRPRMSVYTPRSPI